MKKAIQEPTRNMIMYHCEERGQRDFRRETHMIISKEDDGRLCGTIKEIMKMR